MKQLNDIILIKATILNNWRRWSLSRCSSIPTNQKFLQCYYRIFFFYFFTAKRSVWSLGRRVSAWDWAVATTVETGISVVAYIACVMVKNAAGGPSTGQVSVDQIDQGLVENVRRSSRTKKIPSRFRDWERNIKREWYDSKRGWNVSGVFPFSVVSFSLNTLSYSYLIVPYFPCYQCL